jgi:hypothetical protein
MIEITFGGATLKISNVDLSTINLKLNALHKLLTESKTREEAMSVEMDSLVAEVKANISLDDSILTYLAGLAPMIADVAGDKAKALALADEVKAKTAEVAAAIVANTPQAPPA